MTMLRIAVALMLLALPARADIAIQEVTSPGGIKAWLVEDRSIPFAALEIRFRGGTNLDAPEKRGATNLMAALIEEGAGDLDAQGFAAARDALAAEFSFAAYQDAVSVSARFLTENREPATDLLRLALTQPRFDADAVERVRAQVLSGLESDAKDPEEIAARVLDRLAYGAHPYGSTGEGTTDSVAALTRDDILAAHRGAMARDRVYVAAAGDISATELGLLIDRLLADLPETGAAQAGRADWAAPGGVTVEQFPSPQSVIRFGHAGIKRDDPDFFAAFILNEVLGGGRFSARLMSEVREKRGLTYGIGTSLVPMDHGEMIVGQMATANTTVGQSIDLIRAEWARIADEGITDQELAATKTYLTGAYPLRFDGNAPIARILVGMQQDGLTPAYVTDRNGFIEAVTMDDIRRVAARLFRADDLHFVVVGQPEGLAP